MTKLLELKDVHVKYGYIEALKGIDCEVNEGEIVTLIGANGAGKSNFVKALAFVERFATEVSSQDKLWLKSWYMENRFRLPILDGDQPVGILVEFGVEGSVFIYNLEIGKDGVDKLNYAKVALFGIGGVGSYVLEGLVRAGIGNFILIDNDEVDITNLNRQIIATTNTIGMPKVEVAKKRILEINPNANVEIRQEFFTQESENFLDNSVDYIIDAVDTVTAKIELVVRANKLNIPIISSMGAGNKLDPTK